MHERIAKKIAKEYLAMYKLLGKAEADEYIERLVGSNSLAYVKIRKEIGRILQERRPRG